MPKQIKTIKVKSVKIKKPRTIESLSKRELEIAQLLSTGNRSKAISNELNIKPTTISTFKKRIFEKLEIDNIVSLYKILHDFD